MDILPQRAEELLGRLFRLPEKGELWREGNTFFLGEGLELSTTLERIYESDNASAVELFFFAFSGAESFRQTAELVRAIKKNFRGYLLGRFAVPPSAAVLEQAYAAGLDLLDLPLSAAAADAEREPSQAAFAAALAVFPRWSVLSSFTAGLFSAEAAEARIDLLLARDIVPLPVIDRTSAESDLQRLCQYLQRAWQQKQVTQQPLRPLLALWTPLASSPRTGLGRMADMLAAFRLRTISDIRRLLRVKHPLESA